MMMKGLRKRLALVFTVITGAVLAAVLGVSYYFSARQIVWDSEVWFSTTADRVASTMMTNVASGETTSIYPGEYILYAQANGQRVPGLVAQLAEDASASPVTGEEAQEMFVQAKTYAEENGVNEWMAEGVYFSSVTYGVPAAEGFVSFGVDYIPEELVEANAGAAEPYDVAELLPGEGAIAIAISPVADVENVFTLRHNGASYRAAYLSWQMPHLDGDTVTYELAVMENLSGQTSRLLLNAVWYVLLLCAGLALLFLANWFLAKLVLRPTAEGLRRQTEFVAAASHELRGPLAVIRSSLSAAQAAADQSQAEKYRGAAADEARRMSHLVDDLLLLAGGDADTWQLDPQPVDLDTLLIDAAEVYRPLAKERRVELVLELPEAPLPQVQGDAERLRQILAILMDNALQYAPGDTAVTLAACAKRGRVAISVADRGRGVPDEEKERVFQRFYRADKSRSDKAHFGLGLSVARELAELHGGRITVKDTPDGGATFVLSLPL